MRRSASGNGPISAGPMLDDQELFQTPVDGADINDVDSSVEIKAELVDVPAEV